MKRWRVVWLAYPLLLGCGGGAANPEYVKADTASPGKGKCGFHVQDAQQKPLLDVCVDVVKRWKWDHGRLRLLDVTGNMKCARVTQQSAAQLGYDGVGDRPVRERVEVAFDGRVASFIVAEDPEEGQDQQQLDTLAGEINGPITIALHDKACADIDEGAQPKATVVIQRHGDVLVHAP